jgi:hypothetical protein
MCCQLSADFSSQFGGKIQPLREKLAPQQFILFEGVFALRNKTIFVCVGGKIYYFLDLPRIREK